VRVLMLGPVVFVLSLLATRLREETDEPLPHITAGDRPKAGMPSIHHLLPWFIVGFLLVLTIRSLGLIPVPLLAPINNVAAVLTTISMAALGLGVDVRTVARAGLRVSTAVTLSLIVLGGISIALIHLLHIA
ncbi:MAG TPA: putative sulfate exporter family transporter, partial [Acidocella sp.]|nr:putative sulfate exporter family transporter [Acidocella sp.]